MQYHKQENENPRSSIRDYGTKLRVEQEMIKQLGRGKGREESSMSVTSKATTDQQFQFEALLVSEDEDDNLFIETEADLEKSA